MKSAAIVPSYAIYYYHPDHLGSNTLITNTTGVPYQLFLNLPFGETMAEQTTSTGTYQSPYKFNGKELDAETGLYYYGARYYDPKSSVWLSVDPLAENEQGWTPYRYGFNNPIFYTDPSGLFEDEDAAKAYAKANGIKTGLFRDNKIVKHDDGNYAIENRSTGSFTINDRELGLMTGPIAEGRGLHLTDIGIDGWNERCDPNSESYNPNATLQMNIWDRLYLIGHQLGLALPSAKLANTAKIAGEASEEAFSSFAAFKKVYGTAGKGYAWHHIVEQHADNVTKFGAENINNVKNLIKLPSGAGSLHAKVTGYYNSLMPGTNMRVRDFVKTLNYEQQYQYGIDVLKRFGWKQ